MNELWEEHLPGEYRSRVVTPVAFEQHTEQPANAVRIVGFDAQGSKCFDFHSFVLTDEGFDADEFPIQFDVYYERVFAWRLSDGQWVRVKSYADRLDSCNKRLTTLPVELTATI
jgi:hypothetical protein